MFESIPQQAITEIWSTIWRDEQVIDPRQFFRQRLFVEGYPIFRRYLPATAETILDAGGGSGRYGVKFALDYPAAKIVVADISSESLRLVRRIARAFGVCNIDLTQADLRHLPFPDGYFDVVFCDAVLQHLPDEDQVLSEFKRVLKSGGTLIIANVNFWNFHTFYKFCLRLLNRPYRYGFERCYTHRSQRQLLDHHGFNLLTQDGFYPAYGLYRLKIIHPIFSWLGRAVNRLTKWLDVPTNRLCSRVFGMEIIAVATKIN